MSDPTAGQPATEPISTHDTGADGDHEAAPARPSRRSRLAARLGGLRRATSRTEALVALAAAILVLGVGLGGFYLGRTTADGGVDRPGSAQHQDGIRGDRGGADGRGDDRGHDVGGDPTG